MSRLRKLSFKLSDDLVLEHKGAMLNRDMEFSRISIHIQQVEDQKKRVVEVREKDR